MFSVGNTEGLYPEAAVQGRAEAQVLHGKVHRLDGVVLRAASKEMAVGSGETSFHCNFVFYCSSFYTAFV